MKVSSTNPNVLQFKLYGSDSYVDIALLGGLNMKFLEGEHKVSASNSLTLTATLIEVATVVISPTPFVVKLTDAGSNNLTISIPSGATVPAGKYTIYFEIYNAAGHRLVKKLTVTVE